MTTETLGITHLGQADSLGHMSVVPGMSRARRAVAALASTMRPDGYHGAHARAGFFEGWYVKLVSADRMVRLAVIPGIFLGVDGSADRHDEAFVQVLDGVTGRSWYERYDAADFHADRKSTRLNSSHANISYA